MNIYDIRVIAKNMGIDPKKMNKTDLIKSIQIKRGIRLAIKPLAVTVSRQIAYGEAIASNNTLQEN